MRLAIHHPDFDHPGGAAAIADSLAETARAAEECGAAQLTLMDHYFQMEQRADAGAPMLEGYTTLGFLAAVTERIRLGLLVTGVTYRHPGLLAKIVATLDVLSGGRAQLGIGAAWYEREHRGLGVPFPPMSERFERLEEALQICHQMWSDDDGPFQGRHYQLAETLCSPRPLQAPRPPILVGGMGERKTLRLVAQYADATNLIDAGHDEVRRKLEVLERHCADVGRHPDEIERTLLMGPDPVADPRAFVESAKRYADLGVRQAWVTIPRGEDRPAWVRRTFDAVGDEVAALG